MDPSLLAGPSRSTQNYPSSSRIPYDFNPPSTLPSPSSLQLNGIYGPQTSLATPNHAHLTHSHPAQEPKPPTPPLPLVEPHQPLEDFLESFWTRQMDSVENEEIGLVPSNANAGGSGAAYSLPLARIKKVMKSDEDVKMISAEVPIMFAKACEVFISELTCRAWLVAESNKRRTLQKSDVAAAIAFSDMFDFLIDIVPRDDGDGVVGGVGLNDGDAVVGQEDGRAVEGEVEGGGVDMYNEFVDSDG